MNKQTLDSLKAMGWSLIQYSPNGMKYMKFDINGKQIGIECDPTWKADLEFENQFVSKIKIREIMNEIKEEIDRNPQYANVGKKGCYRRLSELL